MAHILRDLFTGSVILVAGTLVSLAALILVLILCIFFHILGFLVQVLFYIFLCFVAAWLVGFLFRKGREAGR